MIILADKVESNEKYPKMNKVKTKEGYIYKCNYCGSKEKFYVMKSIDDKFPIMCLECHSVYYL